MTLPKLFVSNKSMIRGEVLCHLDLKQIRDLLYVCKDVRKCVTVACYDNWLFMLPLVLDHLSLPRSNYSKLYRLRVNGEEAKIVKLCEPKTDQYK